MAKKLLDQDEAARILGVTPEEVGSLRDRKKLFPYRDGDQWKYKQEDVEQLRDEIQGEKASDSAAGKSWASAIAAEDKPAQPTAGESWAGPAMDDIELEVNDDVDSILLSEIELGKSGKEGPSTIIGKPSSQEPAEEADVLPSADVKVSPPSADTSDLKLADSNVMAGGAPGSDVRLVATGSDAARKSPGPGSTGNLFGSDALSLSDDELSLIGSSAGAITEPQKSDSSKAGPAPDSSVKLGDEDLVLGSKAGSDVTQSPTDSGIQLISASDSGLSLDEPLAMGSSAKELLEVGEADVVSLEDQAGTEAPVEPKADDEFLLTALDESGLEESDSGSQVIALDTEDVSSGMFSPVAGTAMLEEEPGGSPLSGAPLVTPALGVTTPASAGAPTTAEAPFSTGNVVSLVVCAVLLLLCGMMTYDLMRNMWSWNGPYSINSSIMDSLGNTIGWFDK